MSESLLLAVEIIFDVLYLMTVWVLVALMLKRRENLLEENKKIGSFIHLGVFPAGVGRYRACWFPRFSICNRRFGSESDFGWAWRAGYCRNGNFFLHAGSRNLAHSIQQETRWYLVWLDRRGYDPAADHDPCPKSVDQYCAAVQLVACTEYSADDPGNWDCDIAIKGCNSAQ